MKEVFRLWKKGTLVQASFSLVSCLLLVIETEIMTSDATPSAKARERAAHQVSSGSNTVPAYWKTLSLCFVCIALFELFYIVLLQQACSVQHFNSEPLVAETGTILPVMPFDIEQPGNEETLFGTMLPPIGGMPRPTRMDANHMELPLDVEMELTDKTELEMERRYSTVSQVFFLTTLSAIAAGLGATPFFFVQKINSMIIGCSNALAAGLMLSACFSLLWESAQYTMLLGSIGLMSGMLFVFASQKVLDVYMELSFPLSYVLLLRSLISTKIFK